MNTHNDGPAFRVERLRSLLGLDVVLLPVLAGKKRPTSTKWQKWTTSVMENPAHLRRLEAGNIGVSLGVPSNGLCTIDIDNDEFVEPFLVRNPSLRNTLRTKGERGCNLWVRVEGDYPLRVVALSSEDPGGEKREWGEWRATGGQTVIAGTHPSGCNYQIVTEAKPIRTAFESIQWPPELKLPWVKSRYDKLLERVGPPYFVSPKGAVTLNQMFFVAKFAEEHLVLHEPAEHEFYIYEESSGLWRAQTTAWVKSAMAADLKTYSDTQKPVSIVPKITDSLLDALAQLLRGQAERKNAFRRESGRIHVGNGVLHVDTTPPFLTEFAPKFYSRNRSPLSFVEGAESPQFINDLLATALPPEDIDLLQRYCGSLLLGRNRAQKIAILNGVSASGKSTVVEIAESIVGIENVTEMRTDQLHERFEISRFIGRTLLTGKDVPAEFLMRKGASALKKLVGGDFLSAERKNSNGCFDLRGDFDLIITCNSRLRVKLEGDADAWRRRLLIFDFTRRRPVKRISEFAKKLLAEEGPGILNWMVQGAIRHSNELKQTGDFSMTTAQKERVERLLAESDSVREFVRTCLKSGEKHDTLTVDDLKQGYVMFCERQAWHPAPLSAVENESPTLIEEMHQTCRRNDIKQNGTSVRGYKGLRIGIP